MNCNHCNHQLVPQKHRCEGCGRWAVPIFVRLLIIFLVLNVIMGLTQGVFGIIKENDLTLRIVASVGAILALVLAWGLYVGSTVAWYLWTVYLGISVIGPTSVLLMAPGRVSFIFVLASLVYVGITWHIAQVEKWLVGSMAYGFLITVTSFWVVIEHINHPYFFRPYFFYSYSVLLAAVSWSITAFMVIFTYSVRVRWWFHVSLGWSGKHIKTGNNNSGLLLDAAWSGHTATVQVLLDKGADVNTKDGDGLTALMYAAWSGHTSTVQALLNKGADIRSKDKDGKTALKFALDNGHTEIVALLRQAGAKE